MDSSNGFSPPAGQSSRWSTESVRGLGLTWLRHVRAGLSPRVQLVLLHGTGADASSWNPLLPHWPSDWGVWVLDLPGHGGSPSPPRGQAMGVAEMGQSLASLLTPLACETRLGVIVGHSAGAAVGLQALLSLPPGPTPATGWRLLGIAPSLIVPPALYTLALGPLISPVLLSGPSLRLIEASCRIPGVLDGMIRSTGTALPRERTDAMAALLRAPGHLEGALRFMSDTQLEALLQASHSVSDRVELLAAEDDPWIPYAQVKTAVERFLPQARLSPWPKGGHLFHEQQPAGCAAWVSGRLDSWLAAR